MKRSESLPSLVLIHDLLGSTREFDFIAPILTARGIRFDCSPIDGYSHGAGRPMLAWRDWIGAADAALDREHGSEAAIVLAGAGTGAALAAALALRPRRQRIAGVVMLASAFDCCARLASRHRTATRLGLDRWIEIPQDEPFGVKNPKTRKAIARLLADDGIAPAGPARLPLRALRESDRLHAHVRTSIASLTLPLLALHAREDEVAPLAGIERFVDEMARRGQSARLITLEHSYHRITIDNDRQRVAHEIADFLGAPKRRPATAPPAPRVAVETG